MRGAALLPCLELSYLPFTMGVSHYRDGGAQAKLTANSLLLAAQPIHLDAQHRRPFLRSCPT